MTDETNAGNGSVPLRAGTAVGDFEVTQQQQPPASFLAAKRLCDIGSALLALPFVLTIGLVLSVLNAIWNRGPLIYAQRRMGRDCQPFFAYKFRTMRPSTGPLRGPNDPVETDRITPLGMFLRRTRIDELPQFINVLFGEMSLIGPRPDFWEHAQHYAETIPGYRQRHRVRPGITGLAQVDNGYAQGVDETVVKTRHDLRYIETASFSTDFYVLRKTVVVVLTGFGAR